MGIRIPKELEDKILATPGVIVNGKPVTTENSVVEEDPLLEKEFMADVVKYAKREGWKVYHVYDSRKSEAGYPDLHMLRCGVQVVAELKRGPKEAPTPEQEAWLEEYRKVPGCLVRVWRPQDWPEIRNLLGGVS